MIRSKTYDASHHHRLFFYLMEFDIVVGVIQLSLKEYGFNVFAFTNRLLALEHFQNTSENYSLVLH